MIELIPKYKALDNCKRYTLVRGGRGSAKSFHIAAFLLILTYTAGEVILYSRYTMTSAKKSIIPEFIEKMDLMGVAHHFHISDNTITNKVSGSRIIFSGIKTSSGNQTAALKSITGLTVFVLDEAEEMHNRAEFHKIDDSIRKKGGSNKVYLLFNTDAIDTQHWIYEDFYQEGERSDSEYIHATYLDNLDNLDSSFIAKAEAAKVNDPDFYEVNYMGQFAALQDTIYPKPHEIFYEDPESYDWVGIGGDFGFSDNPAAASLVFGSGNNIYARELLYEEGLTNQEIAERLGVYKEQINVWDSSEKKSIRELRLAGVNAYPAEKGPGSVAFGIKKLQAITFHIHADSKNLINEKKRYRWKKLANGEYVRDSKGNRVPVKKDDHLLDGIRYVATMLSGWSMSDE